MTIGGPTDRTVAIVHNRQPVSIGQSEILILKSRDHQAGFSQFDCAELLHGKRRQHVDERKELHRAVPVITPKSPAREARRIRA
jgi:hypothetical protein